MTSLEGIHANAHNDVGGYNGHMTELQFSSFDPLFFLHHANVDRLWAMWSILHPDTYVTSQTNFEGTYAEPPDTNETADSPLFPFHRDEEGNFHTANTVRYPGDLGYTYVEIEDWKYTPDEVVSNVKAAINNLYGSKKHLSTSQGDTNSDLTLQQREWLINFRVDRNVGKTVDVYFFFGDPPISAEEWATASNRILSQVVMAKLTQSSIGTPTVSQLPITRALVKAHQDGKLADLSIESITAFVKMNLQWRIQSHDGSDALPSALQGLTIQVIDQEIRPVIRHDELMSLGQANIHEDLIWTGPYGK
jgi:tyrosinase